MRGPRIVIVGAGITGAFAAYFLARRGAEVTVLERHGVASHASGRSVGGLNPMHGAGIPGPLHALALASLRLHVQLWDELPSRTSVSFGGRSVKRLHIAVEESEAAVLVDRKRLYDDAEDFSARWLDAGQLRELEPRVCEDAIGALLTEGNARVDPGPYTRAVADAAVSLGARILTAEANGLRDPDGRVYTVVSDAGEHRCDAVVLATGAWLQRPSDWLGLALQVEPVKGELLLVDVDSGAVPADTSWRDVGIYAAGDGRLLLGGTEDRAGFDEAPSASGRERILAGAERLLPGIGQVRVREHWAGLRPVTPDGLPIVGLAPGWENVYLATGSGRKGILYSAGIGLATAEFVFDGETALPVSACVPGREALV